MAASRRIASRAARRANDRALLRRMPPRTTLILIMGVAGSGKTTLAKEILRRVWAIYLDNNHIVDAFFPRTRSGRKYQKLRPCFYRALYRIVEENLNVGNSVILDVPHIKEIQDRRWRSFIADLAAQTNARLVTIRCFCSDSVLRVRLCARGEKRDRFKLRHWQQFLREQPIRTAVPFAHLDIDTEQNLSTIANRAVRYIFRSPGMPRRPPR